MAKVNKVNKAEAVDPARPLTARQVADRCGVSVTLVYKLANAGRLAGFRMGTAWRFRPEVVAEMMRAGVPTLSQAVPTPAPEVAIMPAKWRPPSTADLLTLKEAAARLGCTPAEVGRLVETGKLPNRRAGGMLVFDPTDIEAARDSPPNPKRRSA